MTKSWIIAISLGPVAGFIAAGRRSRDLWWGSTWLSELVLALTSGLLSSHPNALLQPREKRVRALVKRAETTTHGGRLTNKILLRLTGDADAIESEVAKLDKQARDWLADKLKAELRRVPQELYDQDRAEKQIEAIRAGDFIEFRAGWASEVDGFQEAKKKALQRVGAGPRVFRAAISEPGLPKCDLDPGRDSVLISTEQKPELRRKRAQRGLLKDEELDALFLARRQASMLPKLPFPPLNRVAAEPWLVGVHRGDDQALARLSASYEDSAMRMREDFFIWCSRCADPGVSGAPFGFDPSLLFEGELPAREKELSALGVAIPNLTALLAALDAVRRSHPSARFPIPYYALVEMDGDGVGYALSQLAPKENDAAIEALDKFSDAAAPIIQKYGGVPFYAAADELMFYIPLDTALPAVSELQAAWAKGPRTVLPTSSLSAGVVFAHVKDDLDATRQAAHRALRGAKEARQRTPEDNPARHEPWIRVIEQPRAGTARGLTAPAATLTRRLKQWVAEMNRGEAGAVSLRTAHIIDEHLERLLPKQASVADVGCMLALLSGALRGQQSRGSRAVEDAKQSKPCEGIRAVLAERIDALSCAQDVETLRDELLLAARISRVEVQRAKEPSP